MAMTRDCKSLAFGLRRFESYLQHHGLKRPFLYGLVLRIESYLQHHGLKRPFLCGFIFYDDRDRGLIRDDDGGVLRRSGR